MNISIFKFDDLNETKLLDKKQIFNLSEQGFYMEFKTRRMMSGSGGNIVQFIAYDSPLVPVNDTNENNKIITDFVSLGIYDENKNLINITDLPEVIRPTIYYSKKDNKNMK